MKLGELKSAIRSAVGNPLVYVDYGGSVRGLVTVQKKSILETLDSIFPGGKSVETGLMLDGENRLILETMLKKRPIEIAPVDLDDLADLDASGAPESLDDLDSATAQPLDTLDEIVDL